MRTALPPSSCNLRQEDRDCNALKLSEVLSPGTASLLQSQVDIKKGRSGHSGNSLKSCNFPKASPKGRALRANHQKGLIPKIKSKVLPKPQELSLGGAKVTETPTTAVVCSACAKCLASIFSHLTLIIAPPDRVPFFR